MPRGPVRPTPTPDHNGTVQSRKGGPLWLQVQGYVQPVTLCQDQMRVSTTAVLVQRLKGWGLSLADHGHAPSPCSGWLGDLCREDEVSRWWWALAGRAGAAGDGGGPGGPGAGPRPGARG